MDDFIITVRQRGWVRRCRRRRYEERSGLFAHSSRCTRCVCTHSSQAELWGENGHLQGVVDFPATPEELQNLERTWNRTARYSSVSRMVMGDPIWYKQR